MRLPLPLLRRTALLACLVAGPSLTACATDGPLAPDSPTRAVVPGANTTGFVVGWGVTGDPSSGELGSAVTGQPVAPDLPTHVDSTAVNPSAAKSAPKPRRTR